MLASACVLQKQKKIYVMLDQCSSDSGPQLTAALSGPGNDASRDEALALLAVIVEHAVFELTEIMVLMSILRAGFVAINMLFIPSAKEIMCLSWFILSSVCL